MQKKVLIVYQDELFRIVAAKMLRKAGFGDEFITCDCKEEALAYLSILSKKADLQDVEVPEYIFIDSQMAISVKCLFLEEYNLNFAGFFSETKLILISSDMHTRLQTRRLLYPCIAAEIMQPFTIAKLEQLKRNILAEICIQS